jgi:phosphoribosylformimino-5-aminoimidazole carboxamide ribotide isomerase
MLVIPAIDLLEGKVVRLVKGELGTETTYFDNPVDAVHVWEDQGAKLIHIVDLDATKGVGNNLASIQEIITASGVELQVGGGVRTLKYASELIAAGVARVACGTSAVKDPTFVEQLAQEIGSEHIIVSLDHLKGKVVVKGWTEATNLDAFELAQTMESRGAGQIQITSVEADGTLKGPDVKMTAKMVQSVTIPVIAAGGIRNLQDLKRLKRIGVYGVVVGKALYENQFSLADALKL